MKATSQRAASGADAAQACREREPPDQNQPEGPKASDRDAIVPVTAVPYDRASCWWLFALLLITYAYVHQDYRGGTPWSRLALLHSLVLRGSFAIDAYHEATTDKAWHQGHYYSDKAPGTVFVALPAFAAAAWVLARWGIALDSEPGWLISSWVGCVGSVGLVTALGGVALFAWLRRWTSPLAALGATLALFLGGMPFTYATVLFSHGLVVGLLAVALGMVAVPQPHQKPGGRERRAAWSVGFCCGLALASEFTAGIVVGGIALYMGWAVGRPWDFRRWKFLGLALCGAFIPMSLVPLYSWACFGNPLTVGYSHQAVFPQMKQGLFGIGAPDAQTAWDLLFSPSRGLFFWSPVLLMAVLGYAEVWQRSKPLFWLVLMGTVLQVTVLSGYTWDWKAGNTLGPRYLSPMLPLLALPLAFAIHRYPLPGIVLGVLSLWLSGLGTLVCGTPGYESNPLVQVHWPRLLTAQFTHNLGAALGLDGYLSVLPLVALWAAGFVILGTRALRTAQPAPGV